MGRDQSAKKIGESFSTSHRSSTTIIGGTSVAKLSSLGTGGDLSSSKVEESQRPTEILMDGTSDDEEKDASEGGALLRVWGDAPTITAPRASMRASANRISFREPTILEDEEHKEVRQKRGGY